jgi:hypothetical protein
MVFSCPHYTSKKVNEASGLGDWATRIRPSLAVSPFPNFHVELSGGGAGPTVVGSPRLRVAHSPCRVTFPCSNQCSASSRKWRDGYGAAIYNVERYPVPVQ